MTEDILLCYKNMPKSAQFFPDGDSIGQEKGIDIVIRQCHVCGLVQAAGEPVSYYRDVIRSSGVSPQMKDFRRRQYRDWVQKYQLEGKRVLEVGAGSGEYMDMMESAHVQVFGLEHLSSSLEKARGAGHQMIGGFIEDEEYRVEGAPYDGFYSMNFLEHIPRPGAFLRGIAANLQQNAAGLVEVPNFDMMAQKALYSEFIQDHLSYFTKQTLCGLLERSGFEVFSCDTVWYGYILSAAVRKRNVMDAGRFFKKQEKLKMQVHDYLDHKRKAGQRVAVWGAGHQALANLSMLDMADKIMYVVDSASFKQNKYTPATHIPIAAPDRLRENEVQSVIIMAAGYSEEVKQIMDRDYPWIESVILAEDGLQ